MKNALSNYFQTSHAFLVGINKYKHVGSLENAVNDVQGVADVLAKEVHGYQVHPPLFNASHKDIMYLLNTTIPSVVKKNDRLLFYFAGHGIAIDSEQDGVPEGYMLPSDANENDGSKSIAMSTLRKCLEKLESKHVFIVLDCCFSGAFRWASIEKRGMGRQNIPKKIFKERFDRFITDAAWQVLTSSSYDQEAFDSFYQKPLGTTRNSGSSDHSPFAFHLINALNGEADIIPKDQPDGLITASEIYLYIRSKLEPDTIAISDSSRQTPGLFNLPKHDKGEYIFLSPKVVLNLPSYNPQLNPYRGLQSYEMEHHNHFYGRDQVVEDLERFVHQQELIVVSGASGTGKSSLIKAGLLSLMQKEGYDLLSMTPGEKPMTPFSLILKSYEKKKGHKTILMIDQFEELITQCHDKLERSTFLEQLELLLKENNKDLKIILTVRSDFEPQFQESTLGNYWEKARFVVPGFTTAELKEVIERPAVERIILFDPPELVDLIVEEVQNAPGALPLLSFTMSEMYERLKQTGEFGSFRQSAYQALGGVIGSLRTRADLIFEKLSTNQKLGLKKLMLRMVSFEAGHIAKRRVYLPELIYANESDNETIKDVLNQMTDARLIVQGKGINDQPYAEPAHDTLVNAWGRLWDWVNEIGKEALLLQNRLHDAVVVYNENNKAENLLFHDDPRLDQFLAISEAPEQWLNKEEAEFIRNSIVLKTKKRRRFVTTLISTIAVLALLTIAAIWFGVEAKKQASLAQREAKSSSLAALAFQRDNTNPTQAIRIAAYANKIKPDNESAKQAMHDILSRSSDRLFYQKAFTGQNCADFSPDGKYILTGSNNGHARIWTIAGELVNDITAFKDTVTAVQFSSDGTQFLTAGWNGHTKIWTIEGELVFDIDCTKHPIDYAKFSYDDQQIAVGSWGSGSVLIIDISHEPRLSKEYFIDTSNIFWGSRTKTRNDRRIKSSSQSEAILAFSDNFEYVLSETNDHTGQLRNFDTENIDVGQQNKDWFNLIAAANFSKDNQQLIIGKGDGSVGILTITGKDLLSLETPNTAGIVAVTIAPDNNYYAAANENGAIYIWDARGKLYATLIGNSGFINHLTFSPNGNYLLSSTLDGEDTHLLWDLTQKNNAFLKYENKANINTALFIDESKFIISSLNGVRILSTSGELVKEVNLGEMDNASFYMDLSANRLWQATALFDVLNIQSTLSGESIRVNAHEGERILRVAISPNENFVITSGADGLVKLWTVPEGTFVNTIYAVPNSPAYSIDFTQDGQQIIIGKMDGFVEIRSLEGDLVASIPAHQDVILFSKDSKDGNYFLTGGMDGTAKIWSKDWELIKEFKAFKKGILAGNFSPDNNYIILGGEDGTAKIFAIDGTLIQSFNDHDHMIKTASFSPSGQFALTGGDDGTVYLWNIKKDILSSGKIAPLSPEEKETLEIENDIQSILQLEDKEELLAFAAFFEEKYLEGNSVEDQQIYLNNMRQIYQKAFDEKRRNEFSPQRLKFLGNYFGKRYVEEEDLKEIYKENVSKIRLVLE